MPRLGGEQSLSTNENVLPARPTIPKSSNPAKAQKLAAERIKHFEKQNIEETSRHRVEDLQLLVKKSEDQAKSAIAELFSGQHVDKEIMALAEVILKLSANLQTSSQISNGSITAESLTQSLMHYIQQQKSFDCSPQELAMLDSLEFHLMRVMATINPVNKIQTQQQVNEEQDSDDSGSSGPEKAEEEDKDGFLSDFIDEETESDTAISPRGKKGKAKARARKNKYRKWLDKMLRAFRRQSTLQKNKNRVVSSAQIRKSSEMDSPFVKTVRIFGRVRHAETGVGIGGVRIISSSFGDVMTSPDGSYAFENVTVGIQYSLAPLKSGLSFSPVSINDIALDSREHNFKLIA